MRRDEADGLAFALMASWPGAIHHGKGAAKIWIDSSGSKEQRHLLEQIVKGNFKGKPWPVFAPTFDKWLDTEFVPFEWKFDGASGSFKAGDQITAVLEKSGTLSPGMNSRQRYFFRMGLQSRN